MEVFNGMFEGVTGVRYVVLYGYDKKYEAVDEKHTIYQTEMTGVIGTYDNMYEAYGHALLYLNDLIDDMENPDNIHVSNIYKLEGDSGYGMNIVNPDPDNDIVDWTMILFEKHKKED